jgi:hypothetical protein
MRLVLPDVIPSKTARRAAKVPVEILYSVDVTTDRVRRVVAALEFLQHHLTGIGHGELLYHSLFESASLQWVLGALVG